MIENAPEKLQLRRRQLDIINGLRILQQRAPVLFVTVTREINFSHLKRIPT